MIQSDKSEKINSKEPRYIMRNKILNNLLNYREVFKNFEHSVSNRYKKVEVPWYCGVAARLSC